MRSQSEAGIPLGRLFGQSEAGIPVAHITLGKRGESLAPQRRRQQSPVSATGPAMPTMPTESERAGTRDSVAARCATVLRE
ncbi:hypothetical protein ElyMa_004425700 [Elysia marginata]|uniref:Uncharacterized protein n=1 Tax=Elysia marginata TaxID=1093978 RepID=A0AAV4HBL2_9GAST|nr:hypothetical protein ElyMa_004425700 [Elysia marginata]